MKIKNLETTKNSQEHMRVMLNNPMYINILNAFV